MKRLSFALAIALGMAVSASAESRTVDYPFISYSNTDILDIARVELTDTATLVKFNAYFRPKYWIQVGSDVVLKADGKQYALRSARNITPDEHFWMPESGQASFTLIFDPLPLSTEKFDFSEGDDENAWNLADILLNKYSSVPISIPAGVPEGIMKNFTDEPLPTQDLTVGESTVYVHFLGNRPSFASKLSFIIDEAVSDQKGAEMKFDDNGNAIVKFTQYGPASIQIIDRNFYQPYANFHIVPGETIDCYIDGTISGFKSMRRRNDMSLPVDLFSIHTGSLGNLDRMNDYAISNNHPNYTSWLDDDELKLYRMDRKSYMETLKHGYADAMDSIRSSNLPEMEKELQIVKLRDRILVAVAEHKEFMKYRYLVSTGRWKEPFSYDSIPATLTDDDYREVTKWFDVSDPRLLIYGPENGIASIDWNAYGVKGDLSKSLVMLNEIREKAGNATLKKEEVNAMRSLSNPFFSQVADSLYAEMNRKIADLKSSAKPELTPDVASDQIFDAIIAPHKGKVVVVDLWNTWCGPCRRAIKQNEPLKTGELADEDIIWIYIADESSDHFQYLEMIPDIKGIHYKLNPEQKSKISEHFNVDGIPYYILVDREGNAKGRPDLRDHTKYIKAIKSLL